MQSYIVSVGSSLVIIARVSAGSKLLAITGVGVDYILEVILQTLFVGYVIDIPLVGVGIAPKQDIGSRVTPKTEIIEGFLILRPAECNRVIIGTAACAVFTPIGNSTIAREPFAFVETRAEHLRLVPSLCLVIFFTVVGFPAVGVGPRDILAATNNLIIRSLGGIRNGATSHSTTPACCLAKIFAIAHQLDVHSRCTGAKVHGALLQNYNGGIAHTEAIKNSCTCLSIGGLKVVAQVSGAA